MRRPDAGAPHKSLCRNSSVPGLELGAGGLTQLKSIIAGESSTKRGRGLTWIIGKVEREGRRDDARPLQSEDVTVQISRLRLERDDEPEATCHGQRLPSCRVSDIAVLEGLIEPPTASASLEQIMSTASTASMGLLTSSRQQPRRGDDIGSLCRNASPSRKGAFSSSVLNPSIAQHARFIATTVYRTCGIVVTSARLTTHSSGPSSFYPTLGACPGPNRPRRCRRGGRSSIIGDALISPGPSTPRAYLSGSPKAK